MSRPLAALALALSLPVSACAGGMSSTAPAALAPSAPLAPDWRRPEPQAIAQAKAERKLVLLSVQAEFCHWCHVMNDTTYRDPRVVALLRERFVTLRIDQAQDPALSARYADYGLAERTLQSQQRAIAAAGRKAGEALLALDDALHGYVMFTVVGPKADPRTQALRAAAYRSYAPHALLRSDEPGHGHYPYPGEPAIFLCSDSACSAPVTSPDALSDSLTAFVRAAREP